MHKTFIYILLSVILTMTCCKGEDRTYEYEEWTQNTKWIESVMKDKYLWGDLLTEQSFKVYFYSGTKFFSTLCSSVSQDDSWSYCLVDSAITDPHARGNFNHLDSYGMDFTTLTDPTKSTSRTLARVTYVVKDSPADKAGLRRNDFIALVDSTRITSSNASELLTNGSSHSVIFYHIDSLETGEFIWKDTTKVTLSASTHVVEPAFPVSAIFEQDDVKVGYLMATRLLPYPDDIKSSGTEFQDDLDNKMETLITEAPDEMILDLRLCNYGTLEMAQRLASYLVPNADKISAFAYTKWNSRYASRDSVYIYDYKISSLELPRIYIIMGNDTQGAAEWLIRGLIQTFGEGNVILVGTSSQGQNVMTQWVASGFGHQLYPAVCYVTDATGTTAWYEISPTHSVSETSSAYLMSMYDFGDPRETLTAYILSLLEAE